MADHIRKLRAGTQWRVVLLDIDHGLQGQIPRSRHRRNCWNSSSATQSRQRIFPSSTCTGSNPSKIFLSAERLMKTAGSLVRGSQPHAVNFFFNVRNHDDEAPLHPGISLRSLRQGRLGSLPSHSHTSAGCFIQMCSSGLSSSPLKKASEISNTCDGIRR